MILLLVLVLGEIFKKGLKLLKSLMKKVAHVEK